MNLPGHRIAACLGKAALKTHALQTLSRGPLTRPQARSVCSASDLSALFVRRGTSGSWSPCTVVRPRGLAMNLVAQPSRLRVAAASRRPHEHRAGRPVHSQARTPALHPPGSSWSQCMRKSERGLSMNRNLQIRMKNHEIRRNTEIRMTKPPIALLRVVRPSSFGFLSSFVIRHSSFNDLCETGSCSPIFEGAFAFFELLRRDKNHGAFFALL